MILWINGTFGAGKTTTANLIREREPAWRLFDPEWVGYMLRANLGGVAVADFQDLAPWRTLVPRVAYEIASLTDDSLLTVQTVLVEDYWNELRRGMSEYRLEVFHVLLDADDRVLRERIAADEVEIGAEQWRLDHLAAYERARSWMRSSADLVIDTSALTGSASASRILDTLNSPRPGPAGLVPCLAGFLKQQSETSAGSGLLPIQRLPPAGVHSDTPAHLDAVVGRAVPTRPGSGLKRCCDGCERSADPASSRCRPPCCPRRQAGDGTPC